MIKFLSKLKNGSINIKSSQSINPHKHWMMLLSVFFILVSLLIVSSLYLLYQVRNEKISPTKATSGDKAVLLKENLLKSLTGSFENKEKNTTELINNPQAYPDPSL